MAIRIIKVLARNEIGGKSYEPSLDWVRKLG